MTTPVMMDVPSPHSTANSPGFDSWFGPICINLSLARAARERVAGKGALAGRRTAVRRHTVETHSPLSERFTSSLRRRSLPVRTVPMPMSD